MKLKKIAIFVKVYTKNYGSYRNDIFRDSFQQEYSKTPKGLFISVKLDIWVNGGEGGGGALILGGGIYRKDQ